MNTVPKGCLMRFKQAQLCGNQHLKPSLSLRLPSGFEVSLAPWFQHNQPVLDTQWCAHNRDELSWWHFENLPKWCPISKAQLCWLLGETWNDTQPVSRLNLGLVWDVDSWEREGASLSPDRLGISAKVLDKELECPGGSPLTKCRPETVALPFFHPCWWGIKLWTKKEWSQSKQILLRKMGEKWEIKEAERNSQEGETS